MKIVLTRLDQDFNFQAANESGATVESDGAPEIGGHNKGLRPMQMVLAALGSCSAIDVVYMLRKLRQQLDDIQVTVSAEREKDKVPSLFTKIHVHYLLTGDVQDKKAERAVNLSMEKLCSVKKLLEPTAEITWSWQVEGN
ncbi:MAG: OsmC family protein [Phaeodactylibacter sp.]|nr:OsmC family protein [Phaeodactylibacter sp.]MCB9274957.1 OsmC family protein [Lewinellaceae bacterium]